METNIVWSNLRVLYHKIKLHIVNKKRIVVYLAVKSVCIKISPPCAASKWLVIFPPAFRGISNITERPFNKKLIKHNDGLEFTSTGVIRCILVQLCSSDALQPRGVHHFSVTVSYSRPSLMVRIAAESDAFPFFVEIKMCLKILFSLPVLC